MLGIRTGKWMQNKYRNGEKCFIRREGGGGGGGVFAWWETNGGVLEALSKRREFKIEYL